MEIVVFFVVMEWSNVRLCRSINIVVSLTYKMALTKRIKPSIFFINNSYL